MEYTKPGITLLGKAVAEIHGVGKMLHSPADNAPNSMRLTIAAYEADE
jgi:hypothetical protein